jgi:hypothetical protein
MSLLSEMRELLNEMSGSLKYVEADEDEPRPHNAERGIHRGTTIKLSHGSIEVDASVRGSEEVYVVVDKKRGTVKVWVDSNSDSSGIEM